jgi:hypothetical protein
LDTTAAAEYASAMVASVGAGTATEVVVSGTICRSRATLPARTLTILMREAGICGQGTRQGRSATQSGFTTWTL